MFFAAFDIGGSTGKGTAYASLGSHQVLGTVTFRMSKHSSKRAGNFDQDYRKLVAALRELQGRFGVIEGIGLALAGKLNTTRSSLIMAGNITHWVSQPVRDMLEHEFGCKVVLGNDAEAAALAEARYGIGAHGWYHGQPFIGMIWGTGVGGASVYPKPGRQLDLVPAEPGHIRISDSLLQCRGCSESGHVEALCGGGNMRQRFGTSPSKLSKRRWFVVADDLAFGLKNMLLALPPINFITFSGGVANQQQWILPLLQQKLNDVRYGRPEVLISRFGASAGSLGALALLTL